MDEEKLNGCDLEEYDDEIVMLTADDGRQIKFFHIGTLEYKGKYYAAFQPAEEVEGVDDDEIVIFEVKMNSDPDSLESELVAVEDQKLLDEVFEEFCKRLEDDCDCEDGCDCGEEHHHHHDHCDCGCEDHHKH